MEFVRPTAEYLIYGEMSQFSCPNGRLIWVLASSWFSSLTRSKLRKMSSFVFCHSGIAHSLVNLALELHPKEARFHSGLCEIYWRKGTKDKAAEACKKALEVNPNFEPAQELMKKLAQ